MFFHDLLERHNGDQEQKDDCSFSKHLPPKWHISIVFSLSMFFFLKLSWQKFYHHPFFSPKNKKIDQ